MIKITHITNGQTKNAQVLLSHIVAIVQEDDNEIWLWLVGLRLQISPATALKISNRLGEIYDAEGGI